MKTEYPLSPKSFKFNMIGAFVLIFLREIMIWLQWLFISGHYKWLSITLYLAALAALLSAIEKIINSYVQKIIITPEEITFQRLGMVVTVKWNDLQRIDTYQFVNSPQESIFAPKSRAVITGWQSFGVYGKEVYIPLEDFVKNWRDSELGQQIKQYAPHLFQQRG